MPVASSADSARQSFEPYNMEWVEPAARLKERHTEESLFLQLVTRLLPKGAWCV